MDLDYVPQELKKKYESAGTSVDFATRHGNPIPFMPKQMITELEPWQNCAAMGGKWENQQCFIDGKPVDVFYGAAPPMFTLPSQSAGLTSTSQLTEHQKLILVLVFGGFIALAVGVIYLKASRKVRAGMNILTGISTLMGD